MHLNDVLTINREIMTASHLLTYVQQQGIVTIFGNVDSGFVNMTLAYLTASAFSSGDIHHLGLTSLIQ